MTAAGVAYFLPNAVSFSMWFFYVAWQVYKMMLGAMTGDPGTPGAADRDVRRDVCLLCLS